MPKRKKVSKTPEKAEKVLDSSFPGEKRTRGRPGVRPSEISGRSYNHRLIFSQIWNNMTDVRGDTRKGLGEDLLKAQTADDVIRAFDPWPSYQREFAPIAALILKVLRDPKFPKRREPQINFLADSLAGWGWISPRRSRDICAEERAKEKRAHYIIRQDYYIECTCRYKGPALQSGSILVSSLTDMDHLTGGIVDDHRLAGRWVNIPGSRGTAA